MYFPLQCINNLNTMQDNGTIKPKHWHIPIYYLTVKKAKSLFSSPWKLPPLTSQY